MSRGREDTLQSSYQIQQLEQIYSTPNGQIHYGGGGPHSYKSPSQHKVPRSPAMGAGNAIVLGERINQQEHHRVGSGGHYNILNHSYDPHGALNSKGINKQYYHY